MKYVSLGIPLQKHVSLRFLFISSKQEDNWNPSWVTVMFPAGETDRSSKAQRTLKKRKSTSLSLPSYSLPTFNIINNSLDQTTDPKRQVARDTRKAARSRNFFFFPRCQWKHQTHQSTRQRARPAAEGQRGGAQTPRPFTTWFFCRESLQPPASCSSGLVCARNACPGRAGYPHCGDRLASQLLLWETRVFSA